MSVTPNAVFNFSHLEQELNHLSEIDALPAQQVNSTVRSIWRFNFEETSNNQEFCQQRTLLDLKNALMRGDYSWVSRLGLEAAIVNIDGLNSQLFYRCLGLARDEVIKRLSLSILYELRTNPHLVEKHELIFGLIPDEGLCSVKLGHLPKNERSWSIAAQRLNIMEEVNPNRFPPRMFPEQLDLSRVVELPIGKFIGVTPALLAELALMIPQDHQILVLDNAQALVENITFQSLQTVVNQTSGVRFYIGVDIDAHLNSEAEWFFNERVLDLSLAEMRRLRAPEFAELARKFPELCGFASLNQLQGIDFAQFTLAQMDALVRGDKTPQAFVTRLISLTRSQRALFIDRCSPQQLSDVPQEVWPHWSNNLRI